MACIHCGGGHAAKPAPASSQRCVPRSTQLCGLDPGGCDCGGLEALCRPRWVAGMVIQESDLNRLDYYIGAKHRLHNRYVHGTGVVCGMEVSCHECGAGRVRVDGGYAIGPCGEDIVVEGPDSVDICALIRHCRSLERQNAECRPWGDDKGCRDVTETWVLAIRYDETPVRNAPMLRAGQRDCGEKGCGCGSGSCDGGGSCGCGNGAPAKTARRTLPSACAPTVVCESYRYEVFRAPAQPNCAPGENHGAPPQGRLVERLRACLADLLKLMQQHPEILTPGIGLVERQQWVQFCMRIKSSLHAHLSHEGTTACALLETLCATPCPSPQLTGQAFVDAMTQALAQIGPILQAAIKDCLCSAVLPPCPEPVHDPRLPLALITVDGGAACRVVAVCNWTPLRRMVGSFPNVAYWLSAFGLVERIRSALFCFCCGSLPPGPRQPHDRHMAAGPAAAFGFDASDFGLFGQWLQDAPPDPLQMLRQLLGTENASGHAALVRRIDDLQAQVAALRRNA
ncbi:hypothetical protein [Massilia sp. BJB1822]|uniref:hypothetical protein n=1 Tax=Massilia sp. BJB1822 TaxID=2744470 RepID=UPI0015940013|nr:hypothetical protein [Massilia sp. BJB1822]NVD97976.1 hypothetical protein [Massilia sp. BJB1822]